MMKLCRFNQGSLGVVEGDVIFDVSTVLSLIPLSKAAHYPLPKYDLFIEALPQILGAIPFALQSARANPIALASVRFDAPVGNPGKIIGAPINYNAHIEEAVRDPGISHGRNVTSISDWGLFLKSSASLIGVSDNIELSFLDRRNDHEIELGVVIGTQGRHINRKNALDFVAGYTTCLDMTLRGKEFQCFRKSIDTYSVAGPYFVTKDEISNPNELDLWLSVNGVNRQKSNTRQMVFSVERLIEYASSFYTLYPGDIIMTGTPEGVGPVVPGDVIECGVQNVGNFKINVIATKAV
jgi:2-keto-4-pentenoate hydratase/2-oxohepta-3-ene-1,7-dioic acid hydratase in catechol pathway